MKNKNIKTWNSFINESIQTDKTNSLWILGYIDTAELNDNDAWNNLLSNTADRDMSNILQSSTLKSVESIANPDYDNEDIYFFELENNNLENIKSVIDNKIGNYYGKSIKNNKIPFDNIAYYGMRIRYNNDAYYIYDFNNKKVTIQNPIRTNSLHWDELHKYKRTI